MEMKIAKQQFCEQRNNSTANKGRRVPKTAEHRAKISAARKGHEVSEETRAKISAAKKGQGKGVPMSAEHKEKISAAKKGHEVSEETRAKISAAKKGQGKGVPHPKVTCPHCQLEGGDRAMKHHHFANCKQNPSVR